MTSKMLTLPSHQRMSLTLGIGAMMHSYANRMMETVKFTLEGGPAARLPQDCAYTSADLSDSTCRTTRMHSACAREVDCFQSGDQGKTRGCSRPPLTLQIGCISSDRRKKFTHLFDVSE